MEASKLSKNYDSIQVLNSIDLKVDRGDRIAFVGQNGQGKTTLARMLVGDLNPSKGVVEMGHNVSIGYYSQQQTEALPMKLTLLEAMELNSPPEMRTRLRAILGAFLFSGEDVDKKISVLSGGERARLALAILLLKPFNLLVLDEPTNHLDIASKMVLKEALVKFQGTLILVSHDRDFLQGLCEKVVSFKDRKVTPFLGDINAYLEHQKLSSLKELEKKSKPSPEKPSSKEQEKNDFEKQKQLRGIQQKIGTLERKITVLEKEIKEIDFDLEVDYEKTISQPNFFDSYQSKKKELEALMEQWEALQQTLD